MLARWVRSLPVLSWENQIAGAAPHGCRNLSTPSGEVLLEGLKNHEASGVPADAGVDGPHGFDLARMHALLGALGSPHAGLPVAHIAGTKGKGSVVAMLSSILHAAGYKVGTYTSPHLVSLRERISLNGQPIATEQFDALVANGLGAVRSAQGSSLRAPSHFEMMTALALQWFQQEQVDIALVEAGLGGARDATNVFEPAQLKAAIFTAIGLEHQAALGGTLTSIAAAKAGIIRKGRPVVVGHQPEPEAKRILCEQASSLGCRVYESQAEVWPRQLVLGANTIAEEVGIYLLNGECADQVGLRLKLVGAVQRDNVVTAASAALVLRQQGFDRITIPNVLGGLAAAHLLGRFQVGRLKHRSGSSCWLVLDGAHTATAAAALTQLLREAFPAARHPLAMVLAMASDKDFPTVMAALRHAQPQAVAFTTVPIGGSTTRSAPPGTLLAHWQAANMAQARPTRMRELIQASLAAAVEKVCTELSGSQDAVICITGSLHAVAAALKEDMMA